MEKIIIPNINNNETEATLVEWLVEDAEKVNKGDIIAILETTKSTFDLEATIDGYIKRNGVVSKKYEFGSSIGWIYSSKSELENSLIELTSKVSEYKDDSIIITEPAQKLIQEHGVSDEQIKLLGLSVVKVKDVERLLENNINELIEISSRQLAISKTVIQSKNSIPDAFQVKKVYVSHALEYLSKYSADNKILAGIPELLIMSVSSLYSKYPYFFGSLINEKFLKKPESANIGVTFDVGKGLFIPVVPQANILSLVQISQQMMIYRMKALRNSFSSNELSESNITISLNMDSDTIMVKPIIFPGQSCMLSVGAILKELTNDDGNLLQVQYIQLGLAYDHRIINGYEANAFLTEIKRIIENPIIIT